MISHKSKDSRIAYRFAVWVCMRGIINVRRATVYLWLNQNYPDKCNNEFTSYVFETWKYYIEPS